MPSIFGLWRWDCSYWHPQWGIFLTADLHIVPNSGGRRAAARLPVMLAVLLMAMSASADDTGLQYTSISGIDLGTLTLAEVQHLLGPAVVDVSGEPADHESSVCYRTGRALLYFLVREMGRANREVNGIRITTDSKSPQCVDGNRLDIPITPKLGGLHLGLTSQQFEKVIGPCVTWRGATGEAILLSASSAFHASAMDVTITVRGKLRDGKLASLEVWKMVST